MIPPTLRIKQGVTQVRIFLLGEDCNMLDEEVQRIKGLGL